jgi:hypothetical protein
VLEDQYVRAALQACKDVIVRRSTLEGKAVSWPDVLGEFDDWAEVAALLGERHGNYSDKHVSTEYSPYRVKVDTKCQLQLRNAAGSYLIKDTEYTVHFFTSTSVSLTAYGTACYCICPQ